VTVAGDRDVAVVHLGVEEPAKLVEVHYVPRLANPPGHPQVVLDYG
jgi:hypothetical protein